MPPVQTSLVVHELPSLQPVPSVFAGLEHTPPLHVPALWHWSDAVHTIAVPPQTPPVHTSPVVHELPSLQPVPSAFGGLEQTPPLQVPAL
jgi:hypothetical protein